MKKQFQVKCIIAVIISLILVIGLAGCGGTNQAGQTNNGGDSQKQYVMRIGTVTVQPQMQNETMEQFKQRLEAKLGDKVKVELYPASQLGTMQQMIQGLQNGSVQGVIIPSGYYATVAPAIGVLDLPYFFANGAQAARIMNSGGDKELAAYLATKGMVPLGWVESCDITILSKDPITRMEDIQGKKIRVFPNAISQEVINSLGASATTLDTAELSAAVQQGTIDGVYADPSLFWAMKLYQLHQNLLLAPKAGVLSTFMSSKTWLDSLPADIRDTICETAMETITEHMYDYVKQYYEDWNKEFRAAGVQIVEPSAEFNAQIKQATQSAHELYLSGGPENQKIYDALKVAIDNYK
ncbi:TRAP transporter substrate-binding protein [Pelotomaculum terephthalicicum JT]|uniref:TRAP transporter substrate-binding protein n=1 Tax=Pelotomaculum TaxID=191373 RepID=UPI0009D550BA|nr:MULTISPECIES: TRAP transporter substrate-binding protein [Pelotomaculum]MCG9968197.1 TRAP transporter substrate-binding protein [Pelotomaculum terephthalicicum JT]OPX83908.1 MAG: 2,3-diketo-L-gulonate-binding periplasmic protein YiaO precursor [Pelotomaculum sp. PtaB.Bin117]OPY58524.1 MAG: 2,3-diketo-L-gulonate-binding periplasmic protein YiaO precursor [Pelotomaculum sp. PtaU1.Bin065]